MADLETLGGEGGETIRCRYCGQLNNVRTQTGQARCGRCRLLLSDEPHKKFAHLDKHSYIHPLDSRALAALRNIPGIDTALKKLLEWTGDSAIRVIFTASVKRPIIVLYSQLVERLNDEEVLAVIAHEVGHIHAEHVLYLTAAQLIMAIARGAITAAPIHNLITQIISA